MQRRGSYQSGPKGRTGYGPSLSTDFVRSTDTGRNRNSRSREPIPGDRRRGKIAGKWPGKLDHGYVVKNGQLPKDLHTVNDLDVLIDILETVAGVSPLPPSFPAPMSRETPSPPTRAPQDGPPPADHSTMDAVDFVLDEGVGQIESAGVSATRAEVRAAREVELSAWKVADLKALCKDNGLKVGGKKAELVERILDFEDGSAAASEAPSDSAVADGGADGDEPPDMEPLSELDDLGRYDEDDDPAAAMSQELVAELSGSSLSSDAFESSEDDFALPAVAAYDDPLDMFRDFGPIKYLSTRGHPKARWRGRFGEAVREGIPVDGGLLAPNRFPDLRGMLPEWRGLPLNEIGARVASMLLIREVQHGFLPDLFVDAYHAFDDPRDPAPLVPLPAAPSTQVLELFHGPTRAADDLVMAPLGRILAHQMGRRKGRFSAVLPWRPGHGGGEASVRALTGAPHSSCFVLCPLDEPGADYVDPLLAIAADAAGASRRGAGGNVYPVFLPLDEEGVAAIGAEVAGEMRLRRQYGASLWDSRNVAHVMMALSHVAWAVLKAQGDTDEEVTVAVDEGDGTQATAALYARLMGFPIKQVVVAAAAPKETEGDAEGEEPGPEMGAAAGVCGMERIAYELAGRDPGVMVEADGDWRSLMEARPRSCGIARVEVSEGKVEAAQATAGPAAESTLRAVAAVAEVEGAGEGAVVVLATEEPEGGGGGREGAAGGSEEEGAPEGEEGGAAGKVRKKVLVGSAQSVTDFIISALPPYRALELHGAQVVAAMHHLKRLSASARDKQQRRKSEDLMDALMDNLLAEAQDLSVKDTCLALKVASDEVRKTEAGVREAGKRDGVDSSPEWRLVLALRERLLQHLAHGPERLSSRLLGLALNALSKAGRRGPELVAGVLDAAQALLLERHPDSLDAVALVHLATAFATAATAAPDAEEEAAAAEAEEEEEEGEWRGAGVGVGVDVFAVVGEAESWRQFGRYGRLVMRMAARLLMMDPLELQPNAFPPLALLFGRAGVLAGDAELREYLEQAVLAHSPQALAKYPQVICDIADAYLGAGLTTDALSTRLAAAVPLFRPQYVTPVILARVLEVLVKLEASLPAPPPHPFLGDISERPAWLLDSVQAAARLSTNVPPGKWTAPLLSRFLHRLDRAGYSPPEAPFVAYATVALKFLATPPPPPSSFDAHSLAGLVHYFGKEDLLEGDVLAALEEGATRMAASAGAAATGDGDGREGAGLSEWRMLLVGAARGGVREGVLYEEAGRRIEAAMEGGVGPSLGDAVSIFEALASSPAEYSDNLMQGLTAVILAEPPTALPPQLLCLLFRAASLQPSFASVSDMVAHVRQGLAQADPQIFNPSHIAAIAASVTRMDEAWGEDPAAAPDVERLFAALSAQTVARASSLYTRHTARTVLQAFMVAGKEEDPAVAHLERIAKGRPTLK